MSDQRFEAFGEPEDKLVEECAELIKAISKGKRFGWKEYHPDRPNSNNAQEVLDEIDDVERAINGLKPLLTALVTKWKATPHDK